MNTFELFQKLLEKYPEDTWSVSRGYFNDIMIHNKNLPSIVINLETFSINRISELDSISSSDYTSTKVNGVNVDDAARIGMLFNRIILKFFAKEEEGRKASEDRKIKALNDKLLFVINKAT